MTSPGSLLMHALAPTGAWRIRLLGAVSATRGGERLTQLGARSVQLLLARLALHPHRSHAREELVELLWPGVELDVGRNRLRQALFGLRQILEPTGPLSTPVLDADRFSVRVLPGCLDVDAIRFEAAWRAGRAAEALELYGGELMPGFYDDWVVEERRRLAALAERVEASMAAGDGVAAARAADRPQARSPRHGLPGRSSLASPPSRPSALAGEGRADVSARRLPVYLTRFFGREDERSALRRDIATARLVTVQGPGGSGKTRLAVEVAASLADASDGAFELVVFAPLVACTTRVEMLAALVATLGQHADEGDLFAVLCTALEGRRALLVLDNFEQLVDDGARLVAELAAALPSLHQLVTSRRALGIDGERTFAIDSLALPRPGDPVDQVTASAAVALFVDRARAARADFGTRPAQMESIADLVRLLEGMPLSIELAAARVRSMTPAQMSGLLRTARSAPSASAAAAALTLLARTGPRSGTDPRHASMQTVIAWSWRLLAPGEASALAASTVFRGGFCAAAAVAVCAADADAAAMSLVLDALVAHSLLRATHDDDGGVRYASLEPVREFAAAQLAPGDAALARERHRAWCTSWACALPPTPSLAEVRAELPNVVAALASAVADGRPEAAIRLVLSLRRALEDVEMPVDGIDLLARATERCPDAGLQTQGRVLLGPLLFLAGRSDAAIDAARRGVAGSPPGTAQRGRALHGLARIDWRRRRVLDDELAAWLAEADAIAERTDDLELQASVYALRGVIANAQRDRARGEALHREALRRWEQLGNRHAVRSGRYNLAVCAQLAGRNVEALERLAEIEPDARALHDWRRLSQLLNVRGNALSELRAWPQAVGAFRDSARVAWECMAMHELAFAVWNLPRALAHVRLPAEALRIGAFAAAFWEAHFGALSRGDRHDLRRLRRLCACQIDRSAADAFWAQGAAMTPAQAVVLLDGSGSLPD